MSEPKNDPHAFINGPIDTPAEGEIMLKRPLYHELMKTTRHFRQYRAYFDELIAGYFESGDFARWFDETRALIAPYVERDPSAYRGFAQHEVAAETLKRFCELRAESVRLQLAGVIPSTIRGQQQDRSQFVDTSEIWLPDLGHVSDFELGRDER